MRWANLRARDTRCRHRVVGYYLRGRWGYMIRRAE